MDQQTATRRGGFLGWRMVALAAITGAMTGPGQTVGVSVFIDHFIEDLGISRSQVSTTYLVGTLAAALVLPSIGSRIDRIGVRRAMTLIGVAFGIALVGMAGVNGIVALTVGFFAIRLLGQGALNLASTLAVTHWFDRRRGMALGILATSTRVLMSLIPVLLNLAIELYSWRTAWILSAVFVWVIVLPIARRGLVDKPSDVGQVVDGTPITTTRGHKPAPPLAVTRTEALKTSRFWIVAAYGSTTGFMSTALNFHQISMLGEAGMSATEAAVMFLPQVIGAAAAGIVFGYFADRLTGRILIPMVMGLMAACLVLVQFLAPGVTTIVYSVALGATMGATRTVTSTLLPRWFGLVHIGSIQSTIGLIGVASTAFGPVAYALVTDFTGSYATAAAWFAIVPVVVALVASLMRSLPTGSGRKVPV